MDLSTKRKKTMEMLCSALDKIDPTGDNSKKYKNKFNKMSDKEFDSYMKKFLSDPNKYFYLEVIDYERPLKMVNIEACAKHLNIPLYEKVCVPYTNMDLENAVVLPEPVAVGYIHLKTMVQMLLKKNSTAFDISQRNAKTNQVTGDSKTSRTTDVESYSMISIQAKNALKELLGARADDQRAKNEMYNEIASNGYVSLENLESRPEDKVALSTLDAYFALMGFKTNLITGSDQLRKPIENT